MSRWSPEAANVGRRMCGMQVQAAYFDLALDGLQLTGGNLIIDGVGLELEASKIAIATSSRRHRRTTVALLSRQRYNDLRFAQVSRGCNK